MTPKVVLLIDCDNVFKTEHQAQGLGAFDAEINRIIDIALNLSELAEILHVRLYGGWTTENVLTIRASQIQQLLSKSNIFPFKHPSRGIIRGRIELAMSLFSMPSLEFATTYKERAGLRRIRLSKAACFDGCIETESACPVRNFSRFTKMAHRACPKEGCSVSNSSVFSSYEQKMVDTMIACDLLSAASEKGVAAVAVLTEDTDLLPAIIQSRVHSSAMGLETDLALIHPRQSSSSGYPHADELRAMGIHLLNRLGEHLAT